MLHGQPKASTINHTVSVDHLAWPEAADKDTSLAGLFKHPGGVQDKGQPSPGLRLVFSAKVIKNTLPPRPASNYCDLRPSHFPPESGVSRWRIYHGIKSL